MRYISTRGDAAPLGFTDAMLAGLARDGGLYVPERWPSFSNGEIAALASLPYAELAVAVMRPFVAGSLSDRQLASMVGDAYSTFRHPAVTPLVQIGPNRFVLELFHGPTLAFKDLAMQLLARLVDHALEARDERATIVVATSGDTGGAAVEAFAGRSRIDLVVLYPHGRISEVQRRMMTTAPDANVHAVAVDGTFDDCQALVKALFNHHAFRDRVQLSAVNSINWARIVAQVVYYFAAALALGAPNRKVSFTVPTGNFGDVFAGYVAKRMGLPIAELVIATNSNDILARALAGGRYETSAVVPTASPSMDIQVSSNFERLLFDAADRDPAVVRRQMQSLAQSGGFDIAPRALAAIRAEFSAGRADEDETAATIRTLRDDAGYLADPHTAVAMAVAEKHAGDAGVPMVVLSTAHPAKFPDAVEAACGVRPALPDWLAHLPAREERISVLPNEAAALEKFVLAASRAAHDPKLSSFSQATAEGTPA